VKKVSGSHKSPLRALELVTRDKDCAGLASNASRQHGDEHGAGRPNHGQSQAWSSAGKTRHQHSPGLVEATSSCHVGVRMGRSSEQNKSLGFLLVSFTSFSCKVGLHLNFREFKGASNKRIVVNLTQISKVSVATC
jgi:hypothetical protein